MKFRTSFAAAAALTCMLANAQTHPTPVCSGDVDCGQKWVKAQEAISNLSLMRLRMVTDTRIETFQAPTFGRMTGVVTKYPIGPGQYEIRAQLQCYGRTPCTDLEARGIDLFNMLVGGFNIPGVTTPGPLAISPASTPAPSGSGKDAYQAEQFAKTQNCSAQPQATMWANGPGFENYSVPCTNGDMIAIRCEFGNCRLLQ